MPKNLLNKTNLYEDLKETGFNMATAWTIGQVTNTISNAFFHFNINQYNSVKHLVMGMGIGTFTYKKAGGGTKGILAGLIAATIVNTAWEAFENGYVFGSHIFQEKEAFIDTMSDIAVVYAGTTLSFCAEKLKYYLSPKYPKGKEKWVL